MGSTAPIDPGAHEAPGVTRSRWSSEPATASHRDISRETFSPTVEYLRGEYAAVVRAIWERSRTRREDADGRGDA